MTWKEVFMPLALRAFKKIHYNYAIWGLGQQLLADFDAQKINQGYGILAANETAVCDAITQEFINSPLTNGANLQSEIRYYSIFREMGFSFSNQSDKVFNTNENGRQKRKNVDLVLNRYKLIEDTRESSKIPVLIEAKRYHSFKPNITTGEPEYLGSTNEASIKKDIAYLKEIREKHVELEFELNSIKPQDLFIYVLFWGLLNTEDKFREKPDEIINTKFCGVLKAEHSLYEYLPIKWKDNSVTDWVWICLSQINHADRKGKSSF